MELFIAYHHVTSACCPRHCIKGISFVVSLQLSFLPFQLFFTTRAPGWAFLFAPFT